MGTYRQWEMGSNLSEKVGIDLSDFINKLKALYPGIESDDVYPKAIQCGARLLADRIEAATPIRFTELEAPSHEHATKFHKRWHPPGQAKRSVIVYRRQGRKSYIQADVNANVSYLVGYEKSMAYYMYWNEYGRKGQPARPVIRPVFDSGVDEALQLALEFITADHEKRLGGA
jgi:hypothetical protein